jgi:hypothetical protein
MVDDRALQCDLFVMRLFVGAWLERLVGAWLEVGGGLDQ